MAPTPTLPKRFDVHQAGTIRPMELVGLAVVYAVVGALVWNRFAGEFRRDYGQLARPLLTAFIVCPLLFPLAGAVARRVASARRSRF